jgi:hypothetical protein
VRVLWAVLHRPVGFRLALELLGRALLRMSRRQLLALMRVQQVPELPQPVVSVPLAPVVARPCYVSMQPVTWAAAALHCASTEVLAPANGLVADSELALCLPSVKGTEPVCWKTLKGS